MIWTKKHWILLDMGEICSKAFISQKCGAKNHGFKVSTVDIA
jgi:hypothetical protein